MNTICNPNGVHLIENSCPVFSSGHVWIDEVQCPSHSPLEVMRQIKSIIGEHSNIKSLRIIDCEKIGGSFELLNMDYKTDMRLSECTDALCILDRDGYDYMVEELLDVENMVFKSVGSWLSFNCFEIYILDVLHTYTKIELTVG